MAINFLCPNGHKLTAPDEQAGIAGKCPKCAATFRVPASSERAEPRSGDAAARWADPAKPAQADKDDAARTIAFLCPNGHRLNSPANLVGRPGQCPHCGVKFLVPGPDESPQEQLSAGQSPEAQSPAAGSSNAGAIAAEQAREAAGDDKPSQEFVMDLEMVESPASEDDLPMIDMEEVIEANSHPDTRPSMAHGTGNGVVRAASGPHPLADLVASLWSCKAPGATVEVRLVDGEVLAPDGYAKELSRRSHGVFAIRQPDGTHTLTAIAWDAVARVSVRGVQSLRAGMFEG